MTLLEFHTKEKSHVFCTGTESLLQGYHVLGGCWEPGTTKELENQRTKLGLISGKSMYKVTIKVQTVNQNLGV